MTTAWSTHDRQETQAGHEHGTPLFVVDHAELRQELRPVPQVSAAGAAVLRREGESRAGDRADAVQGGGELRRGVHAGV